MVYLIDLEGHHGTSTIGLFGIQYTKMTEEKQSLASTMFEMLKSSADHIDCVNDKQHKDTGSSASCSTIIFNAYWLSSSSYQTWQKRKDVLEFWSSLPADAGIWREVMTVPVGRFMHASSQDEGTGMARMAKLQMSMDQGYWGVYRNRLAESQKDSFTSPFITDSTPSNKDDPNAQKPIIELSDPTGEEVPIRNGRVSLPMGIDNLVYVREYQHYGGISESERSIWSEQVEPHAKAWIDYLDKERKRNGILSFRTSVGIDFGNAEGPSQQTTAEMDQFGYFLDLAHFERAGKSYREHHKARSQYMKLYSPQGELADGKVHLMVELCILKKEDLEAEYVGCVEGTGLMFLERLIETPDEEDRARL